MNELTIASNYEFIPASVITDEGDDVYGNVGDDYHLGNTWDNDTDYSIEVAPSDSLDFDDFNF